MIRLGFRRFIWMPGDVVIRHSGAHGGDLATPKEPGSGRRRSPAAADPIEKPSEPMNPMKPLRTRRR